jgi:hypothetical protein
VVLAGVALSLFALFPRSANAQHYFDEVRDPRGAATQFAPPPALFGLLSRACPDARVQSLELDAVRTVEGKLAVAAAMRAAARSADEIRYGSPDKDGRYHFANTPREVATAVRQNLGASSLVSRSVDTLAFIVDSAEAGAQVPLDQLNAIADILGDQGRRLGLRDFPVFRFRSRIENDRAGVTLSARW